MDQVSTFDLASSQNTLSGLSGLSRQQRLTHSATVAHPTELIKCKLQLQMIQPDNVPKQFSGPFDVVRQTVEAQGVAGMWRGLGSTFIYRSCMGAMFGSESGGFSCSSHQVSVAAARRVIRSEGYTPVPRTVERLGGIHTRAALTDRFRGVQPDIQKLGRN